MSDTEIVTKMKAPRHLSGSSENAGEKEILVMMLAHVGAHHSIGRT